MIGGDIRDAWQLSLVLESRLRRRPRELDDDLAFYLREGWRFDVRFEPRSGWTVKAYDLSAGPCRRLRDALAQWCHAAQVRSHDHPIERETGT